MTKQAVKLDQLPKGWTTTTVAAIGKVVTGTTPSKACSEYYGDDYPFFKPTDLNYGYYVKASNDKLSKLGVEQARLLPEKTIMVTCIGATIGKTGLTRSPGACNQQINAIVVKNVISPEFIYFMCIAPQFQKSILEKASATTLPIINKSKFERLPISLAPLREQVRLVNRIEELFSFLDAGTESLRKVQVQLKRYRQAVLKYAFDGKLTEDWRRAHKDQIESAQKALERASLQFSKKQNTQTKPENGSEISVLPDGWVHARLENFIYIAGRIGWRGLKADEYTEDGPLFLSVYNLNKGNIVDISETYHISEERYSESPEIQLRNDDILLAKDGAGIGKIGIVQGLTVKATVNSSLLVIRSGLAFKSKFLFYFFKGPRMQELVKSRITGSATPHLFQRDIRKFDLLIPPLLEQEQIIAEIESRFSVVDQVENIGRMSVKQAGHLRQTILKDAFEGKLVPQDSNDQPAEELLECVKAECLSNRNSKSNNQLELSRYVK